MKNAIIIKPLILLCLMLYMHISIASAQTPADNVLIKQFENSFTLNMMHPADLYANCIPIVCILKLDIDSAGIVSRLTLSDSANELFKKEFNENIDRINVKSLQQYCDHLLIKNKIIIIPINYSFNKIICTTPLFDLELLNKYYNFNGNILAGDIKLLPSISVKWVVHDKR